MRLFRSPVMIGNGLYKAGKFEGITRGTDMSKTELQRSKAKLQDSLGRMSGHMDELGKHMEKTEKTVEVAAQAGHAFLGEIDQAAAEFIADLNGSNGPEDAVNQPELAGGRDEAGSNPTGDNPPATTE